jgi:hypothetical protein
MDKIILYSILKVYIDLTQLNQNRKIINSSLFDINVSSHTYFTSNCAKSFFNERFRENIRLLTIGAHKFKFNVPFLHMISYKMVSNFNVFGARVLDRIFT